MDTCEKTPFKDDDWSVVFYLTIREEWNNFGVGHQNNVCFNLIREDGSFGRHLWYSQFVGPFYDPIMKDFISGTIALKGLSAIPLDTINSQEIKRILIGRKFRIKIQDWKLRLRNRFNLLEQHDKIMLMSKLKGKDVDEIKSYLESASKIDFMEV